MSRSTKNVQVTELPNGLHREVAIGAPAHETANARVELVGPFRHAALSAALAATPMLLGAVDAAAPSTMIAHSDGEIVGVTHKSSVLVTAGGAKAVIYQPQVAPAGVSPANQGTEVDVASAASGNAQSGVVDQTTPIEFNKGDAIGVTVATNATLAPTTMTPDVYLLVRWAPSSGSPTP